MSLGIRRFWESVRLYLILQLIQNAGTSPTSDSRELKLAAALISGTAQKPGSDVAAFEMRNMNDVTSAIFGLVFGIDSSVGRVDSFAEALQWDKQAPEVPGWMYGWSGSPSTVESMKRSQAILLAAVSRPRQNHVGDTEKLLLAWWKDLDKLSQVASYCRDVRRQALTREDGSVAKAVEILQRHLNLPARTCSARLAVARAMRRLAKAAYWERITSLRAFSVDEKVIRQLGTLIGERALDPDRLPTALGMKVAFVASSPALKRSLRFGDRKARYLAEVPEEIDVHGAEQFGDYVRQAMLAWAFSARVAAEGIRPVNTPAERNNFQPSGIRPAITP